MEPCLTDTTVSSGEPSASDAASDTRDTTVESRTSASPFKWSPFCLCRCPRYVQTYVVHSRYTNCMYHYLSYHRASCPCVRLQSQARLVYFARSTCRCLVRSSHHLLKSADLRPTYPLNMPAMQDMRDARNRAYVGCARASHRACRLFPGVASSKYPYPYPADPWNVHNR